MKTNLLLSLLLLLLLVFAISSFSPAQGPQGPPAGTVQGPVTNSANSQIPTDFGKSLSIDRLNIRGQTGDFLVGNVVVSGGDLPWDPIPVAVTCDGKARYTTTADAKGNFEITSNATLRNGDSNAKFAERLTGCSVQASLRGFDSTALTIKSQSLLDNPSVGTITLKAEPGSPDAEGSISSTTTSAPKEAKKAFEKARSEWQDQKPEAVQRDLEKAVHIYPQYAEAWYQLGKVQEMLKSPEASDSFSKAAAADPKYILPYGRLAELGVQSGNWQQVVDATNHALEINPRGSPQIWYYNALGNYKLGKKDVAETSVNKALAMDPLHTQPNTEQVLAVILADRHDFAAALQHLRNCLTYLPNGPNVEVVKQQIAQLEQLAPDSK